MRRTSMQLAAAVLAGGLAVAGCGTSLQLGAAATSSQGRVTSVSLTNQVANLTTAYAADKRKGITPQHATQLPQAVLTWLITFQIWDRLAQQHGISVSPAQVQAQLKSLAGTASQQGVTVPVYVSAAGAVPPDLLPQIGRYFAIMQAFQDRLDGGKTPGTAGQAALAKRGSHAQCLAAKSLGIQVNPQYGEFDYTTFSVVPAPATLSANGGPSASASARPRLSPPC